MKYMTPELLARYQSDDEGAALKAYEQWEEAGDRYRAELLAIRPRLPQSAVDLTNRFALHDARVLWAAVGGDTLVFVLRLDGEGGGLQLEYGLAEPATLITHPGIAEDCPLEWLYDEFALAAEGEGAPIVHSILFTDGSELRLAFTELRWRHFPKTMFLGRPGIGDGTAHRLAELLAA
jgi:hypothetical protein